MILWPEQIMVILISAGIPLMVCYYFDSIYGTHLFDVCSQAMSLLTIICGMGIMLLFSLIKVSIFFIEKKGINEIPKWGTWIFLIAAGIISIATGVASISFDINVISNINHLGGFIGGVIIYVLFLNQIMQGLGINED